MLPKRGAASTVGPIWGVL